MPESTGDCTGEETPRDNVRRRHMVEFGDCDPAQIVYYPNYFLWFDRSTQKLFAEAGLPLRDLTTRTGVTIPLVGVRSDFTAPATWGDELTIDSRVSRWGTSSFDISHRVTNTATGELIAEATETHVCIRFDPDDPKAITTVPVPDEIRTALGVAGPAD